jgi:hypothetical protein
VEGSETAVLMDLIDSGKINLIKQLIIEFHTRHTKVTAEKFIESISSLNFYCRGEADRLHPGSPDWIIYGTRQRQ